MPLRSCPGGHLYPARPGARCPQCAPRPDKRKGRVRADRGRSRKGAGRYDTAAWQRLRAECLARDGHRCTRCPSTGPMLAAHHVVPRRAGGRDVLSNLVTLCPRCHAAAEVEARRLYPPVARPSGAPPARRPVAPARPPAPAPGRARPASRD